MRALHACPLEYTRSSSMRKGRSRLQAWGMSMNTKHYTMLSFFYIVFTYQATFILKPHFLRRASITPRSLMILCHILFTLSTIYLLHLYHLTSTNSKSSRIILVESRLPSLLFYHVVCFRDILAVRSSRRSLSSSVSLRFLCILLGTLRSLNASDCSTDKKLPSIGKSSSHIYYNA